MDEPVFDELKRYVAFSPADGERLRALHPHARPAFPEVAAEFYERILANEGARRVLTGGESSVGRLKVTLAAWMEELLAGPWDEAYYDKHARIGRVHVRIGMPQHYMFGAMNVVRRGLTGVADRVLAGQPDDLRLTRVALDKLLDLELAIMLHTYREDLEAQHARAERLSTFGQLVGSIGHELRNPLGVMETSLYILKGRMGGDATAAKHAARIGEQLGIANRIISDLLDMIRDKPLVTEQVPLAAVVQDAAAAVHRPEGVALSVEGLGGLPAIPGDPLQLRQVFVNLLDNAVHAVGAAGTVRVTGSVDEGDLLLAVEDSGPGVDPAAQRRLFEPLVTTKAKGIGLGLALVKRILERHGGQIAYEPRGLGARFAVRLPLKGRT